MSFSDLQTQLGISFRDENLLKQAFVHRSSLNEDKTFTQSNERLEFLGDAILSYLTSAFLYREYPQYPEGILTNIRSGLVKTKTLSDVSKILDFGRLLFLSKGEEESGGRENKSLLADCFEAFLGALYLDQGLAVCESFLVKHLFGQAKTIVDNKLFIDFKSHLQEVIQEKSKISPVYRVFKSEGPDHNKTFWIEVLEGEKVLGQGSGKSKQEAEQLAAQNALENMGQT